MGNILARLLRRGQTTPAGNALPTVVHQVLDQQLGPGRLIVVGDVHGCIAELHALLEQIQFQPGHDNLVLVGDLVGKGPHSQEVVSAVRGWAAAGHAWSVRGNWCDAALAARRQLDRGKSVQPKVSWASELSRDDERFLQQLPFSLQIPGYWVTVVHAGLVPGISMEHQQLKDLYRMRDVLQQSPGTGSNEQQQQRWVALEKPAEGSVPWAQQWQGPNHVFFGHDAKRRLQLHHPHATGLDSGCCYGGQLTACILPPLSVLQQSDDFRHAACPTLHQLQGQLSSVESNSVYEKPGKRSSTATAGSCSAAEHHGPT